MCSLYHCVKHCKVGHVATCYAQVMLRKKFRCVRALGNCTYVLVQFKYGSCCYDFVMSEPFSVPELANSPLSFYTPGLKKVARLHT